MAKSVTQTKPSFGSILSMPAQDAVRPPTLPRGFYVCAVESFREDKSSQKQTPFTEFQLKVLRPWEKDGVIQADEDELEEYGEVKDAILNIQFYQTEKSIYRLREFLEHCGVDLTDGKSFEQAIPEARNCQVIARVTHRTAQDSDAVFAQVSRTLPVEE
jgi:hypothetical protein